ncbi:hypothetical protein T4B_13171 [Trichinella pseudospiralis]|uniref:Uncharacterized protein n=1 Tax=Trichinella pseudospiralis TaxID=6337 RepID=A0A0V1J783_TRIPS|nr:hypothetical protein T4B_13171 [Trichinella pseudospiralis]
MLEANPKYTHVKLTYGKETTVSLRHLAPAGGKCVAEDSNSDQTQVGTGAPGEDEKEKNTDANDHTPENAANEENTAKRDEPHQTPSPTPHKNKMSTKAPAGPRLIIDEG